MLSSLFGVQKTGEEICSCCRCLSDNLLLPRAGGGNASGGSSFPAAEKGEEPKLPAVERQGVLCSAHREQGMAECSCWDLFGLEESSDSPVLVRGGAVREGLQERKLEEDQLLLMSFLSSREGEKEFYWVGWCRFAAGGGAGRRRGPPAGALFCVYKTEEEMQQNRAVKAAEMVELWRRKKKSLFSAKGSPTMLLPWAIWRGFRAPIQTAKRAVRCQGGGEAMARKWEPLGDRKAGMQGEEVSPELERSCNFS